MKFSSQEHLLNLVGWATAIVYIGGGVATVIITHFMPHQSNVFYYVLGAALRFLTWPGFWLIKLREYLIGF